MTELPDNNPKSAIGVKKIPLQLVPPSATHYIAQAFADGAVKYGPYNWREKSVAASVYIAAMKRHIDAWWDGEDLSSDAKVEHLAHAMACAAIILDAASIGKLVDDRPPKGAASRLQEEFAKKSSKSEWKDHMDAYLQDESLWHEFNVPRPGGLYWEASPTIVQVVDKGEQKRSFLDRFMRR